MNFLSTYFFYNELSFETNLGILSTTSPILSSLPSKTKLSDPSYLSLKEIVSKDSSL